MTPGSGGADVVRRLLAFVEGTSDLVGVVDQESRVVYLNNAARKRLGVGDGTELTTAHMFPPQAFTQYYDEIRPELLRSGTWHGEVAVLTGSGEASPMTMTIVAEVGPGGEVNTLVALGPRNRGATGRGPRLRRPHGPAGARDLRRPHACRPRARGARRARRRGDPRGRRCAQGHQRLVRPCGRRRSAPALRPHHVAGRS